MALEHVTTPEGMDIYVDTMPEREVAKITAFVDVGSVDEPDKLAGISHALEHCTYLSTRMFANEEALNEFTGINSLDANADTYYTRTCYYASGPHVDPNMKRLGELLFQATFNEEYIANELSVINREAHDTRDDMSRIHDVASDYALFGKPYGRSVIGYADKINFSVEQLKRFYERHYTMSNMALIAVGNVRMEEILQGVEHYFDHSVKEKYRAKRVAPNKSDFDKTGLLFDDSDLAAIRVASPMDRSFVDMYLKNKVNFDAAMRAIGGLCYRRFRLDTGVSYDGSVDFYDLNDPVAWSVGGNATISPEDTKKATSLFKDILSRPSSSYSNAAIASAIGNIKGETLSAMDSIVDRMELYIQDLEHQVTPVDLRRVATSVRELSHEGVRSAIDEVVEYIGTHPLKTHISGSKRAIKSADKLFRLSDIA